MTELTQEAVMECFRQAQDFLKGGAKATNKRYDVAAAPNKAREADLRVQTSDVLNSGAQRLFPGHSVAYGKVMREMGNTFANSAESTGLAASYVAERMPDVALTAVRAPPPYDHTFLMVGAQPSDGMSISDLRSVAATEKIFVVDVWSGICCHASEFDARLKERMERWDHEGKRVTRSWEDASQKIHSQDIYASMWGAGLRGSPLTSMDARRFGSEAQLPSLRNFMARGRLDAIQSMRGEEHQSRQRRADIIANWSELQRNPGPYHGPDESALTKAWEQESKLREIELRRLQNLGLQAVRSESPLGASNNSPATFDVAHDMTEPTPEKVLECYSLARAFFKGGAKSDNKRYDADVNPVKSQTRNDGISSGKRLDAARARSEFQIDSIGYGQVMRETGNTFGNCGEATGVAASYVAQLMPQVDIAVVDARPFDHWFLVVGAKPASLSSVAAFNDIPKHEKVFVMDVWTGICCHASDFRAQLTEKMSRWDHQGKYVAAWLRDEHGKMHVQDVKPSTWAESLLKSKLKGHDPHNFGSDPQLRQLRNFMDAAHHRAMGTLAQQDRTIRAQRRAVADAVRAIETDRDAFVRDSKTNLEMKLAAAQSDHERASLGAELHTLQTNQDAFVDKFKEEQQRLGQEQRRLDSVLQQIGMKAVRSEGRMAPIARQRASRPAGTDVKLQPASGAGRGTSRRR